MAAALRAVQPWPIPEGRGEPARLAIIVPTFNERDNLAALAAGVSDALAGEAWEMIVVDDDSPDGTTDVAHQLHGDDPRVRVLRRIGRRGLASACIEGFLATSAPFLAVMDGDLQHDPRLLAVMLERLGRGDADLVVATRYAPGGGVGPWSQTRLSISRLGARLARLVTGVSMTDPLSGYFAVRREVVERAAPRLSGIGFKILLDLVLTAGPNLRIAEAPFIFGHREHGQSKLSLAVMAACGLLVAEKLIGRWAPVRLVSFIGAGLLGLGVHFAVLAGLHLGLGLAFTAAQIVATGVAIVSNFWVNNLVTYADRSLTGWRWVRGLAVFVLICGFGALANVGMARFLFDQHLRWDLSALSGIAVSAFWNYAVSARYAWGVGR